LLLEKMSTIMQGNSMDNVNQYKQYSRSLNRGHRKRQLLKITSENQAILRRIQTSEPTYNHWEWEEQRKVSEHYMVNICEFKPQTALGGSRSHSSFGGSRRGMSRGGSSRGARSQAGGFRPNTAPVAMMSGSQSMASNMGRGIGGVGGGQPNWDELEGRGSPQQLEPLEGRPNSAAGGQLGQRQPLGSP
jgi:hypothetical protein